MTEEEARAKIDTLVPRETFHKLEAFVALLCTHATTQNLIAASTIATIWQRHILDSAQLASHAPTAGRWVDMGSGAGLPGLVIAVAQGRQVMLIEPRAKRCQFLAAAVDALDLGSQVTIVQSRVETAPKAAAAVISARAVAPLSDLFGMGLRHAIPTTTWVLPKGRSAAGEVAVARTSWHARFALAPSVTDSEATIIVATDVSPKRKSRP